MPLNTRYTLSALALPALLVAILTGCTDTTPPDTADAKANTTTPTAETAGADPAKTTGGSILITTGGDPAANSPELITVDKGGLQQAIADRAGKKAVVVNMWATWCAPCVEEFPDFVEVAKEHPDELDVMFVSHDFPEAVDEVYRFLRKQGVTWPTYHAPDVGSDQTFFSVMSDDWTGALPATLVVAKDGSRVAFVEGQVDPEKLREYVATALE